MRDQMIQFFLSAMNSPVTTSHADLQLLILMIYASASSVASSRSCGTFDTTDQSSDKVCGHAGTGYFNSKTYQKSHVPMRESFPLSC